MLGELRCWGAKVLGCWGALGAPEHFSTSAPQHFSTLIDPFTARSVDGALNSGDQTLLIWDETLYSLQPVLSDRSATPPKADLHDPSGASLFRLH